MSAKKEYFSEDINEDYKKFCVQMKNAFGIEEPKKKRVYTCVRCDKSSCRVGFVNDKNLCDKCDEETTHYEFCWRKAMGDFTDRSCIDVYKNVFVNSHPVGGNKKLSPDEKLLLNEIYLRSGHLSNNPFIFRLLPAFQPNDEV